MKSTSSNLATPPSVTRIPSLDDSGPLVFHASHMENSHNESRHPATTIIAAPPRITEILVVHHSHMDIGYTHSQPVFWELQSEFISQALDWLEETARMPHAARPKWTCEASEPVRRWLAKASSTDVARFVA